MFVTMDHLNTFTVHFLRFYFLRNIRQISRKKCQNLNDPITPILDSLKVLFVCLNTLYIKMKRKIDWIVLLCKRILPLVFIKTLKL